MSGIKPLYAGSMWGAHNTDDLDEMKALAEQAEAQLASEGDIAEALEGLKAAIAKQEAAGEG